MNKCYLDVACHLNIPLSACEKPEFWEGVEEGEMRTYPVLSMGFYEARVAEETSRYTNNENELGYITARYRKAKLHEQEQE